MLDENFVNLCADTSAMYHRLRENTETICDYLNEILETLPDFVLHADNDDIRLKGFYVDELGRLRYETTTT